MRATDEAVRLLLVRARSPTLAAALGAVPPRRSATERDPTPQGAEMLGDAVPAELVYPQRRKLRMSRLKGCLRGAVAVASAGCIVGATTTAAASRPRLDAWGAYWVAQGRLIAFTGVSSRDAYHSADARLWMMNAA